MTWTEPSDRSEPESSVELTGTDAGGGRGGFSTVLGLFGRAAESGALAALFGGVSVLGGLRTIRNGDRGRGLAKLALGAVLVAIAYDQWSSRNGGRESDVDQTDVVDTGLDTGGAADEGGDGDHSLGGDDHAVGEAAGAVVDTGPDVDAASSRMDAEIASDAESVEESETETVPGIGEGRSVEDELEQSDESAVEESDRDGTLPEDLDRLGEAAFDAQSREVPVPQRAFNQGFLSQGGEAFWGVRDEDGAVFVSRDYDAVADREGVRYVASSEIATDVRELPIADAILDHWDDVYGGGDAVVGGDDVLFVTTEDLSPDHLLRVLPASWADDAE